MNRCLLLVFALVLALIAAALPAFSAPRTLPIRSIAELSHPAACLHPQVAFQGLITHARITPSDFFVQQNGWGLYVKNGPRTPLLPGDRVRIEGIVQCDPGHFVQATSVLVLSHGDLPAPVAARYSDLIKGRNDATLVTVRGTIRSADLNTSTDPTQRGASLRIETGPGLVNAQVHSIDAKSLESMIDAEVEVTGIARAQQNRKMQRTGVVLYVGSLANVHILHRPTVDPWKMPITPLDEVLAASNLLNLTQRVRVHGTVTYQEPGHALALQDGQRSLWLYTNNNASLRIGDHIDAIGFPVVYNGFLLLLHGEVHPTGRHSEITPLAADWPQLSSGSHIYSLVSTQGYVVMQSSGATEDRYVMNSNGETFTAILRHDATPVSGTTSTPAHKIAIGTRILVSGICIPSSANYGQSSIPFNILLRSTADIQVLHAPSLWNTRNLGLSILLLLIALFAAIVRFWRVERTVRREMALLAYSERRRSKILEQINGSVPLADIVEQTTELVSFRLQGNPCWVQIAGGARLGNQPSNLAGFTVHEHPILSRSGLSQGSIFVGFDPNAPAHSAEKEALKIAASLIELAIETRQILTELVHRSEFDLLTDVQNRFALERSLNEQISTARASATIFGLVYIDLNGFKQVNDLYGHQNGDSYLKEIALRMKQQLRPGDLLARLGGDEFAILVTNVRTRAEVQEITRRLERCFDQPFHTDDCTVQGSASIGFAMYPDDAPTSQELLAAADLAMYGIKSTRN